MDLIKFIIIATISTMLIGCFFLANIGAMSDYFLSMSLTDYNRYDIRLVDENDINYINWIIPGIQLPDNTKVIIPDNTKVIIPDNTKVIKSHPKYKCPKCPNMTIPDSQLGLADDTSRNFGTELPWDEEIGFCDVLKGTDRDLYKNVQDSSTITFY